MLDDAVAFEWSRFGVVPPADERHLFSTVLDCFDTGVALLGETSHVVHANGAMRSLEKLGVFRLGPGALTFADRGAGDAFDKVVARARGSEADSMAFVARDPARSHAVLVRVIRAATGGPAGSGAILLATNPNRRTVGDGRLFQIALDLSRAESGVAVALLEGLDAKEAAARLHVSHETVRTHLKRIFEKTHTRRQAELLLVLMEVARVGVPAHPSG